MIFTFPRDQVTESCLDDFSGLDRSFTVDSATLLDQNGKFLFQPGSSIFTCCRTYLTKLLNTSYPDLLSCDVFDGIQSISCGHAPLMHPK